MENGKVQEAVSCDLLLGISKNIIKGSGRHKLRVGYMLEWHEPCSSCLVDLIVAHAFVFFVNFLVLYLLFSYAAVNPS